MDADDTLLSLLATCEGENGSFVRVSALRCELLCQSSQPVTSTSEERLWRYRWEKHQSPVQSAAAAPLPFYTHPTKRFDIYLPNR